MADLIMQGVHKGHAIVAKFAAQIVSFIISASAEAGGSVSPVGDISVVEGASQSFTATPDAGFDHVGWDVDGSFLPVNADGSPVIVID
jgi:hypothetical protein